MLQIKNITKIYQTDGFKQTALDNVSVNFRKSEFASILGPSGSGKTTLLNIIGGLDHYTNGDLIINGTSTKTYRDSDWDSYRNHRIGFVFQSYNLITHQTILSNVMLALTLSGISKKESMSRAKKALKEVGLEKHLNKRPNQLSGGQMQRVAIARALVNDPDILLADEPTGALDSETSIQIMNLLKKISENKLVIMVTHNPELASEYSSRIINLKDGHIISDSNPYEENNEVEESTIKNKKSKKTKMSFKTALSLSFNNLMTKKGRTLLVAFAGSIGIIGIALILAVSTGFQNYVDSIQEDTLTSYPLTIMQESTDITGTLLSLTTGNGKNDKTNTVIENQLITSMLSNISANDLKSFNTYLKDNYKNLDKDISSIKYSYSVDPLIYTIDVKGNLSKINPNNLFTSMYGGSSMLSSYSSMASIFSQMIDDKDAIKESYDILAGRLPENYDEMILVLSEPNTISDLLVYSLGLRDTTELTKIITKVMSGEGGDTPSEPLSFSYDDLMNIKLKLINSTDTYKYNSKYKVYEDMTQDEEYMMNLYKNAIDLKIVGIVSAKEGTTTMALSPGVAYTKELTNYIIDYASKTEIVKKQLKNSNVDVFSGNKFENKKVNVDLGFKDLVNIDSNKLQSAFGFNITEEIITKNTATYMNDITNSITADITPASNDLITSFDTLVNGVADSITTEFNKNEVNDIVDNYLNSEEATNIFKELENKYVLPSDTFKQAYAGLLKSFLAPYIDVYNEIDSSLTSDENNKVAIINNDILNNFKNEFMGNVVFIGTVDNLAKVMTETVMKKEILSKVGELTGVLTKTVASSLKVDEEKMASAFSLDISDEEMTRIMSAMTNNSEKTAKSNLISLGYQDLEEPTFISFYFTSFDGKENFLSFIDSYNDKMKKENLDDKVINYSDTTGILMGSVKTIVNAVSYVLIAFVSISLVVSSIMIGIITYISVYERTKEIGILRAIGASKHNISSIFNAETFIIGLLSGLIGIGISYIDIPIINAILHHYIGNIPLSASLAIKSALILVVLSVILTLIGGFIPAKSASKKDPVESLRCE